MMRAMEEHGETPKQVIDSVRIRRLREDAARPLSVNLAEGIALSHLLAGFVGVATRG